MAERPGAPLRATGDGLLRHRWITAAGMTATIAAIAGGGILLARHESGGEPKDCGLVPCTARLPPSATAGITAAPAAGTGGQPPGRAPAARTSPAPASSPRAALAAPGGTGPAVAPRSSGTGTAGSGTAGSGTAAGAGGVTWAAGQGSSADRGVGIGYEISRRPGGAVEGRVVILNRGRVPVTGWRLRLLLPGDGHYQVINARDRLAGDSLVVQAAAGQDTLRPGSSELVAFTAEGASSAPVTCRFEDAASARRTAGGAWGGAAAAPAAATRTAGRGPARGDGGQDGSPRGGWPGWPGNGGGWPGDGGGHGGWPGGGWRWPGNGGGWPGWPGDGGGRGGRPGGW